MGDVTGSRRHQFDGSSLSRGGQQGMRERDGPAPVLAVDHRTAARSDDAEERIELVGEGLRIRNG